MHRHALLLISGIVCMLLTTHALAQGVSTGFFYQGRLAISGSPATGTFEFRFRLFTDEELGTQLGEIELPGIAVSDGLFQVELDFGSAPFGESERWLEIAVREPPELNYTTLDPRQRVSPTPVAIASTRPWLIVDGNATLSGGRAAIGTIDPLARMHVTEVPISNNMTTLFNDDLILEDTDAILSLVSDAGGGAGSGLVFKELDGSGNLTNTWGIYRRTSGAGSNLRFSYGTSPNYATNPTVLELTPSGTISTLPRLLTKVITRYEATLDDGTYLANTVLSGAAQAILGDPGGGTARFHLNLPDNATIKEVELYCYDDDAVVNISGAIFATEFGSVGQLGSSILETADSPGLTTITTGPITVPTSTDLDFFVNVGLSQGTVLENLQVFDLRVTYEVYGVE